MKITNKVFAMLTALIMALSLSVPAFAAEVDPSDQTHIREQVVEIIANASSTEERDQLLTDFLTETPLAPVETAAAYTSSQTDTTRIIGMPDIINSVSIDENTQVDFYSTGDFGIRELENLGNPNVIATYATAKYTSTYRTSYTIKNIFGGKIVETYVKGYFKYDGVNTPTAYLEDAGYSKGTLIFWDCSTWDDGTGTHTRDKTAHCYADAYYDWTLDISLGGSGGGEAGGVKGEVTGSVSGGLTIQDCNVLLKLISNKNGTVSATVSLEA